MVQGLQENRFVKKGEISATTWGSITGTQSDVNVGGFTNDVGYLTSITSGQVITALGYTPYNATNPSGYITSSSLSGYLQNNVGISGGTTLIGGTLSGNNLTLSSTSHATKGKILFGTSAYDEVNNRLGIGTISPTASLDVSSPSGGVGTGIRLIQATNNVFQPFSYTSIDFTVPTTGLIGQFFATASNYSNPNVNLAANSIGLLSWDTNAQLLFGAVGSNGYISFDTGGYGYSNERMRILANGNVGIGQTSPTAVLHIKAGTATAGTAPLKFTSGTNLTTPEAGVMEYDGTSLFFTPASTRYNVLMNGLGLAGGQTVVGGTASGNNLTLSSTSNATKGKILFGTSAYDEVNNRLGVGTNSPSVGDFGSTFTVKGTGSEVGIITAQRNVSAVANGTGFQTVLNNASSNPVTYSYFNGYIITNTAGAESGGLMFFTRNAGTLGARMTILNDGNTGIGTTSPTAYLHLKAGTATANTAPLKFTSGTNTTVAVAGQIEYNNTFHLTNSDATRRHVVTAPNTTKVTAAAPYTNDGYIIVNIGGIDFKLMTTA